MNSDAPNDASSARSSAVEAFRTVFGAEPEVCAAAPGRVNLIGEHTDYSEGFVLPIAINLACIAAVRRSQTGVFRFRSVQEGTEAVVKAGTDASTARRTLPAWSMYPVGVAMLLAEREFAARRAVPAVDVMLTSNVPPGGGLSSSAALEVSTAVALCAAWSIRAEPLELARLCRRAEHEFAGVPCGIMDQFASLHGRSGHAMLLDCRSESAVHVPLPPAGRAAFLVCNSNVRHELSGGEYAERREWCEGAAEALGVRTLRDASSEGLERPRRALSNDERLAATHVISENARAVECARILAEGSDAGWPDAALSAFGERMTASHRSLRDCLRVSCAELDSLVDIALGAPGVWGSRMTGGGFGGCTVTLVESSQVRAVTARLAAEYRARHGLVCTAFVPIPSPGARVLI